MKILVTLPLNEGQKERLEMNFRHLEFCYCLQTVSYTHLTLPTNSRV